MFFVLSFGVKRLSTFIDHILVYILHIFEFSYACIFLFVSHCSHLLFVLLFVIHRWALLLRFQLLQFWIRTTRAIFHDAIKAKRRTHLGLTSNDWITPLNFDTLIFGNRAILGKNWVYSTRLEDLEFRIEVFIILLIVMKEIQRPFQSCHLKFTFKHLFSLVFILLPSRKKNLFLTNLQSFWPTLQNYQIL